MTTSALNDGIGTLHAMVIDVNNLETCGNFWSQILGADVLYQDDNYLQLGRKGERLTLMLQKVPEPHQGKNRVHLDLDVADLEEAVSRVQELGGRKLKAVSEYNFNWVVMADPDGNEFCLVRHG